ncbi:MAG TPA: cytochrome ubiquinol oxidase subunit I [Candidatus Mailhella merdigallinarum]|uniref:Cytochrome ubiquinol oxidase subunit I n=1 Tax=Candidatus Mailhella merdigallinarum TaxID=2838658 RepID=A0A9D2KK98_9BACT|nr:cytochrome ubiquinol oxidase subunit I [Desulfovibrionaceae bacterium]PWM69719.1 MAG: cytochrome ubiquinol oxidase subunit I [Desulfovibrionaceae bacterium]HJA08699.1 cytochrome ubiquinol oxidase subunit I [Candidatus Mailhella merdigallinarum]
MDVILLSRLQFAVAVFFHFIFVPLTLGITVLLAIMETLYVRTGDETYKRMTRFWGKLFLINFVLGVVTGITLEFQFGTNWSRYSAYVGDIFGSLLAIEATVAFFLESTFVAVWAFGWNKVGKKLHCFAIWAVAAAGNLSAVWIILANGFMQNPVGYTLRNGRAELENFWAVLTNPYAWGQFFHTVTSSWMLAGFFVLGISAWHLARRNEGELFRKSVRIAAPFTLIMALLVAVAGHQQGMIVAEYQPAKLAAMESHWETGSNVPMYVLAWPDEEARQNSVQAIPLPGVLSFMAFGNFHAEVKGLDAFPADDIPPVLLSFLSFRLMVALGGLFILLAAWAWLKRGDLASSPLLTRLLVWLVPLPYIGIMAGWMLAEVGRQPWIVYGLMRTSDAVSPVPASSVGLSLLAFIVIYTALGILDVYLLIKYARKGPKADTTGSVGADDTTGALSDNAGA